MEKKPAECLQNASKSQIEWADRSRLFLEMVSCNCDHSNFDLISWFPFSLEAEFSKKELPAFLAAGVKLRNFLSHRQLPMEKTLQKHRLATAKEYYTRQCKAKGISYRLDNHFSFVFWTDESELVDEATTSDRLDEIRQEIEKKAEVYVKRTTYKWKEVDYDKNAALAYLLAKAPYDYACTSKVLNEIKRREPDFKPYSHFDFGSGVGSAVW